jgi:hypothetical protein
MLAPSVRPDHVDELPDDLESAPKSAKLLRMSLQAWHRWRMHPTSPLPCYRLGGRWFASRAEILGWVAARSRPQSDESPQPAPAHSRRRQREIEAAIKACEARGC